MAVIQTLSALAVVFFAALVGGRLASRCHIPRVTGYLLVGLLAGPSVAHLFGLPPLLPPTALDNLAIVSDIALGLILLNIGAQFRLEHLRRWGKKLLLFSAGETLTTFFLVATVTAGVFYATGSLFPGWTALDSALATGLLFGTIAMTTAPAATLMVIREYESEGPVTNLLMSLIGLNNLLTILSFTAVAHWFCQPTAAPPLLLQTCGPLIIGAGAGFALSVWAQRLDLPSEQKLLLLGGSIAVVGLCRALGINPLLGNFAFGMVLANSSPVWHKLLASLRQIDYPLYVVFFVLAGARLHLETLAHIGLVGIAYVAARTTGKWLGATLGARLGGYGQRERECLRFTLFAQGGVAIGLATSLGQSWPVGGHLIETVILGSVVVFELVGPLAVRHGLVRAGEVPILSLLQKRAPQGTMEGLHSVVYHFRSALGLPAGHRLRDPGDILVRHVMRQNVETIRHDTPFQELLRLIAHSRYDRFPVVDGQGHFIGMINYTEIRNLLFEPSLVPLIVAGDLVSAEHHALAPDQSLRETFKTLQANRNLSFFPVIDPVQPDQLLGILSQNEVLATFRRLSAS